LCSISSPVKFLPPPPPQCSVDVTASTSIGYVICDFTNIVSPSEATVSMNIKGYCTSDYSSTTFGKAVVFQGSLCAVYIQEIQHMSF